MARSFSASGAAACWQCALLLFGAAGVAAQNRSSLAAQMIGLNMQFLEAQRAGPKPADGDNLTSHIWSWKGAAFTDACATLQAELLTPQQAEAAELTSYPGYFEAGNAVIANGPVAFAAAQMALGMLHFGDIMDLKPAAVYPDPDGCLELGGIGLRELVFRQMRFMAKSLSAAVVRSSANVEDFMLITGISDSSAFETGTTWTLSAQLEDKCYYADFENPAADIAGQVSVALALLSKVFAETSEQALAKELADKAVRAYEYSVATFERDGDAASCFLGPALANCAGDCAGGRPPCELYANEKGAQQQVFAAAAALYSLTGNESYWQDADAYFLGFTPTYYNWNNVFAQGITILAGEKPPAGVAGLVDYKAHMRSLVGLWTNCSTTGQVMGAEGTLICELTDGGNMYPVEIPWGHTGSTTNLVCMATLYHKYGLDETSTALAKNSRCMVQRQLGFLTNHKCTNEDYLCNTAGPGGFSYVAGFGDDFPRGVHSRDAAEDNWGTTEPNVNTLCGAVVSGPFASQGEATDLYVDDRGEFEMTEAGVDYTASIFCALAGYASMTDAELAHCEDVRGPLDR